MVERFGRDPQGEGPSTRLGAGGVMSASGPTEGRSADAIRHELVESSRIVGEVENLDPATKGGMTSLLAELVDLLDSNATDVELEHVSDLSRRFRELVDAAKETGEGLGTKAEEILGQRAAAQADAEAPVLTNVVRRLIDLLSEIGI